MFKLYKNISSEVRLNAVHIPSNTRYVMISEEKLEELKQEAEDFFNMEYFTVEEVVSKTNKNKLK